LSDERKNIFFNFLQVELLPHLGSSLYDALDRLKVNIHEFNEKFGNNVRMFDSNFSANVWHLKDAAEKLADNIDPIIESTQLQKEFLQTLKTIGYNRMAEANIKVFNLMKQAGPQFVEFIQKQKELNESIATTASVVSSIESIMNRVKTFEEGVNKLGERIDNADYMGSDLLKKVNKKMEELDNQFEVLKQHSQKSNKDIQEFFDREYEAVSGMVSHIRNEIQRALDFNIDNNPLQKLHLLDKLHELEGLQTLILDNKETLGKVELITKEAEGTKQGLATIQERLSSIDRTLTEINKNDEETVDGNVEKEDSEEPVETEEKTEDTRSIWGKLFGSNGKRS
jgi:archaellum component FlaC